MGDRLSYADIGSCLEELEAQMRDDRYEPDVIVTVSRGGLVVGQDLSHRFDTPLGIVDAMHYDGTEKQQQVTIQDTMLDTVVEDTAGGNKLLVVDDITDSGGTLEAVVSYVDEYVEQDTEVRTAVLHKKPWTSFEPDYCVESVEDVRYPWEVNEDW